MDKRLLGYINWALLACMLLLYFTGVANLYSASGTRVETGFAFESFYQRQLVWGLCGLGCMLLATLFDYRQLRNLAWPAYLIFLVLLMLVPLVGSTFYGAKRSACSPSSLRNPSRSPCSSWWRACWPATVSPWAGRTSFPSWPWGWCPWSSSSSSPTSARP